MDGAPTLPAVAAPRGGAAGLGNGPAPGRVPTLPAVAAPRGGAAGLGNGPAPGRAPTLPAVAAPRGDAAGLGNGSASGRAAASTPALTFAPELLLAARGPGDGIAAAIFDVDGVLTDGRIYIGEAGEEFKAFSTLDGHGLKLLGRAGIVPIVVTGRDSPAVRRRVADLGLAHAAYGAADKLAAASVILDAIGLDWNRVAVMGDDWPDLPLMRRAAFACAPPDAHIEAKAIAGYVTTARAGYGAAREFCDLLLVAAGRYATLLAAAPQPDGAP